jgi:N4-gp56 family major capsid protein
MKSIFELTNETAVANVRGSTQLAGYTLQPVSWLREIIDAAKIQHYHAQFAKQAMVPVGQTSTVFPYRTEYIPNGSWSATVAENTDVAWTTFNKMNGVEVAPADYNAGIAFSERSLRTNALNLVRDARADLVYHAGDLVDISVRNSINASANQAATGASGRGSYTVYGGDARADSELATGDTLTPDMLVKAKTKLNSTKMTYWNPSSPAAEALNSSVTANPWKNTPDAPFVAIIAPEQEEALLKDSQFMNAGEYGGREAIMNGEIGKFVSVKIVSTPNTKSFTASGTAADGGGAAGATGHRCLMFKSLVAAGLAWGQKPRLRVFDWPSALEKRMILDLAYGSTVIQKDAIVNLDVADE